MAEIGRLNNVIRAWEEGRPAFTCFANASRQTGIEMATAPYDGVVWEMEHNPFDVENLQDALQYMLNRRQIALSGSLAPAVTPIVRIPANGVEKNQFLAKQALDRGAYGIVWPHISNAEEAYSAVSACRYARPKESGNYEPVGRRGDGPNSACRYWGLTQQEYYAKADVWPLNPQGELLVIIQCESVRGLANLDEILRTVPGVGCVLIGEGDLSQELGFPRQYEHPVVKEAMGEIVATCKKYNVAVGQPHVTASNVERVLAEGYRFLMAAAEKKYTAIDKAKAIIAQK
jgi:4-hydroxy-2-oxoheptanedioate aldolase